MKRAIRETTVGLIEQAAKIRDDREAIEFLQRAAIIGDRTENRGLARQARSNLIQRSHDTDLTCERLAAFAWYLHAAEASEQNSFMTLWIYKWIVDDLPGNPDVTLGLAHRLIDDLAERFRHSDLGTNAADQLRLLLAVETGRADEAGPLFDQWDQQARDSGSDCLACRTNLRVRYHLRRKELALALEEATPLVGGKQSCSSVPHVTFGHLVVPMLLAGETATAARFSKKGLALMRSKQGLSQTLAQHAQYHTLTGDWPRALKLIETRLTDALLGRDYAISISAGLALWLTCAAAEADGHGVVNARFGVGMPGQPGDGIWETHALLAWSRDRTLRRISRLDRRNGTSMWKDEATEMLDRIGIRNDWAE